MNYLDHISIEWILASVCIGLSGLSVILARKIYHLKQNVGKGNIVSTLSYISCLELSENLSCGMLVLTYDIKQKTFIITYINGALERVDQVNRKAVVGTDLLNLYPYCCNKDLIELCQEVWETGFTKHSEIFIPAYENFTERYRDYYIYKLTSGHVVSTFKDITRRKRLEKNLLEGQSKWEHAYHKLNRLIPDGLISCTLDGKIIETNVSFQKMIGYTDEELVNISHKDITAKDWQAFEEEFIPKQLKINGYSDVYHKDYIRKDKTLFKAEIQTHLIKDEKDQPVSTWSIVRDITDHENTISSLKESRIYIENILSSMLNALIVIDMNLTIKKVNKALLQLTGFSESDLKEKKIDVLLSSYDQENLLQGKISHIWLHGLFSKITPKKSITHHEIILNCKSEIQIPAHFFCSMMVNHNNKPIGFVSIIRDAREEIIKNEQMNQAERYAALGEVIPGVGHELSQPLNVIKIINQSLLRDIEKNRFDINDLQQDLDSVINEVNKMSEIIDHMRLFARSAKHMEKVFVDMEKVIKSALRFFSQQLKNRTIEAALTIQPNLPMIKADPARMEQMMVNLITNARDSLERSENSQKVIHIKCYKFTDDSENRFIVVEVLDNGRGLPEKLAKSIFEPNFIPGSPWDGTGMGIAIAKKIIEEHDGSISMQNSLGEGTTFILSMPVPQ